jgi:4-diphosphocytidyl-2-C-methyl-D-erythritol kinase
VTQSRRLALHAPAKINLYLHVTGRRDDGYHSLDSLVAFAEAGDHVSAEQADELSLEIVGPFAASLDVGDVDNLVMRAARALREAAGTTRGAALRLEKSLPVASGIGGGSADAAATLRLLSALWDLPQDEALLGDLALALGADVPVCLAGRPAVMSGIGETVKPVPALPPCGVLLVNAREPVSTPAVFRARTGPFSAPAPWAAPSDTAAFMRMLSGRTNDLTRAAIAVSPLVGDVLETLAGLDGCRIARLSGSGGTCFGLFDDVAGAERAAMSLAATRAGWWVRATAFLAESPSISAG